MVENVWLFSLAAFRVSNILFTQVSRLLVGGVKVVGVYVWAGETSFKNSTLVLCQVHCLDLAPSVDAETVMLKISMKAWVCASIALFIL